MTSSDGGGGADALAAAHATLRAAYTGVRTKPGKGVPHARLVAEALRDAGCDERVRVAGLLHDIVEDTAWTLDDVRDRFGAPVAELVAALTEDDAIHRYRPRKRALRKQIIAGGPDAIDIALADKIASLRYIIDNDRRLPARKSEHYAALLVSTRDAARHPELATKVGELLARIAPRDPPLGRT